MFFNRFLNGAFPNRGSDDTEWERGTSRKGCTGSDLGENYSEQCTLEKIRITAGLAPWSKSPRKQGSDFPLSLAALYLISDVSIMIGNKKDADVVSHVCSFKYTNNSACIPSTVGNEAKRWI